MGSFLLQKIVPFLLAPIYGLLVRSWRIRESGPAKVLSSYVQTRTRAPCVFAHWHGDELVLVGYYSHRNLAVLASHSKDGTLMAKTLELLGYQVYRGSSSKGGAGGLIGLIRAVRSGSQAALAVDGPRGPIYEVKSGVVDLAQRTEKYIIPVRTRCDRAWYFPKAWNKSYLPKPFARVEVEYGEPIKCVPNAEESDTREACALIKARLDSIPGQYGSPSPTV